MSQYNKQIKDLQDYFNLDLKQSDVSKIERILSTIKEQPKKKQQQVDVPPFSVEKKHADIVIQKHKELVDFVSRSFQPQVFSFELEMKDICVLYKVEYNHVVSGLRMNDRITSAKAHFCRYALLKDPSIKHVEIAEFLKLDRSTINHLVHYSTIPCKIPRLIKRRVPVNAIFLPETI